MDQYDVIVVGGGTAGVIAALQSGRAGAKTLLVEKTGILGGTITNGGINFPGLFCAWGKQVIAGIGWELVRQTVEESGGTLPDFTDYKRPHPNLHVRVNAFVYAALCDEALGEAGVSLLLHTMPAAVQKSGTGWTLTLCTKEGLADYNAKVLIDATGDANLASLAGLPINIPEENQPATLSCNAVGYDAASLDLDAINAAYKTAVEAGRLGMTDGSWNTNQANATQWLRHHGNNASHVHHINARTSQGKTELELAARKSLLRLVRFLREQPGLENLSIESVSPECGVRETATIQGKTTVTVEDYKTGRRWEDSVCNAFYPIDLHVSDGRGLSGGPLEEGTVPTVPRGALLPEGSTNFLVAGRCLSSDRLANSALRVEATCMGTGQAAGAMAALAAQSGKDPEDLAMEEIRTLLKDHGAILP